MGGVLRALALGVSVLGAFGAACGSAAAQEGVKIIAVTHGQASDPFWSIVKNGMSAAAAEAGVSFDYRAPETFDMVQMAQLIEAAVNQKPAGIVISNPDPDALGPAIGKAVAAGIPVISMNSGLAAAQKLGIRLHVGQDESEAGRAAGARLSQMGARNVLCVNQEVGNAGLDQRCQGVAAGLSGGRSTVLPVTADPAEVAAKIQAALTADPSVDGIIGLSAPLVGEPAAAVVERMGASAKVKVASFDLSSGFLKDIEAGKAAFAVDQQPYLQGFLPVTFLALNARHGLMPASDVASGPSFVTKDTARQVIEGAGQGIR